MYKNEFMFDLTNDCKITHQIYHILYIAWKQYTLQSSFIKQPQPKHGWTYTVIWLGLVIITVICHIFYKEHIIHLNCHNWVNRYGSSFTRIQRSTGPHPEACTIDKNSMSVLHTWNVITSRCYMCAPTTAFCITRVIHLRTYHTILKCSVWRWKNSLVSEPTT